MGHGWQKGRPKGRPVPGLRYWRERRVLSQRALAVKAGVMQSTIALLEGGQRAVPQTIQKLAFALEIGVDDLLVADQPDDPFDDVVSVESVQGPSRGSERLRSSGSMAVPTTARARDGAA